MVTLFKFSVTLLLTDIHEPFEVAAPPLMVASLIVTVPAVMLKNAECRRVVVVNSRVVKPGNRYGYRMPVPIYRKAV